MAPAKGVFLSFEGGEATGKTTQISLLSNLLTYQGIAHIVTREPGGSAHGDVIRKILLDPLLPEMSLLSQYFLLLADRHEHIETVIKPALAAGKWVICDRFQDSSRVYQGIVGALGLSVVDAIYAQTIGNFWPNLTFVLEVTEDEMRKRLNQRTKAMDRFDQKPNAFHVKVRQAFNTLARECDDRMVLVTAMDSPHETHQHLVTRLATRYPQLQNQDAHAAR